LKKEWGNDEFSIGAFQQLVKELVGPLTRLPKINQMITLRIRTRMITALQRRTFYLLLGDENL